jgi:hypothetical protein
MAQSATISRIILNFMSKLPIFITLVGALWLVSGRGVQHHYYDANRHEQSARIRTQQQSAAVEGSGSHSRESLTMRWKSHGGALP